MIESIGIRQNLAGEALDDAKDFIQTVVYSGKNHESYVDTRVRLYQELKEKTYLSIPPDSVEQTIKRCHLQVFIWKRCYLQNIEAISYEENGWKDEKNSLIPKWFAGKQLPPSLSNKRKREKNNKEFESDADEEASEAEAKSKRKTEKRGARKDRLSTPTVSGNCPYEGDSEIKTGSLSEHLTESESAIS